MKTWSSLIFGLFILFVISLSSCVKDYQCECTTTYENGDVETDVHIYNGKHDWAEETCKLNNIETNYFKQECELK